MEPQPDAKTVARALKLLASQKRASQKYYEAHKETIKERSVKYWEEHREAINARRRERYEAAHPKTIAITE
jgi:hypothetical protein